MEKSLIKNISLGIACLLGVGGVISAASFSNNDNPFEVAIAAEPVPSESLSGDGTQESPYLISSASDLIKFRDIVNGGSYTVCAKLTSDITFTGENNWNRPIGNTYSHRYLGVFDGCGYTISGITFNKTNERLYYYGLFGCVGASTIKNVTMKNGSFTVDSMSTGAIVGCIDTGGDSLIENCHNVSFDLNFVDATHNGGYVGGIVGETQSDNTSCNVTIRNCGSTGNITSSGDSNYCDAIGGVVGFEFTDAGDNIINCYNAGTLHNSSNTEDRYPKVGGIIGWARFLSSLRNCHNYGSVSSDKTANNNVGGAIGNLEKNVSATLSSNYYLNTTYSRPIGTYDGGYSTATFPKALTADEFKNTSKFTGWDFEDVWHMGNLYPELGDRIIQASATGYEGSYDGQPHSISVSVSEPTTGYTISYSTSSTGEYTSTNPTYTDAGTYTTYYLVTAEDYVDAMGSETINILKASPVLTEPTAKSGLTYNGKPQELINAGSTTGGTLLYKLDSGKYSPDIPTATNAGNYTVYYKVDGGTNYEDIPEQVIKVSIIKANPTYVVPTDIEAPYDVALSTIGLPEGFDWMDGTQKIKVWGINTFKAKYTPSDTANYNIVQNIDVKVNVKWILVDPNQEHVNVDIEGADDKFTVDITIKVEIKTEITVEQKRSEYSSLAKENFVNKNEDIAAIYGVKLIRTVGGVEEEIQPSDIKEGAKIIVSMNVPDELVGKEFRLLHIHNANDIQEVDNYALIKDNKTLMVEVDRLSEFAFVIATDTDNGFIYGGGLPGIVIVLIILLSIVLLLCLFLLVLFIFFPVYYIDYSKREVRRAIYLRTRHGEVLMLNTHLAKVRRNETDVYKKKSDALNALNK